MPTFITEIIRPKKAADTPAPGWQNDPEFVASLLAPFGARLLDWVASTGGQSWLAVVDAPSPELMKAAAAAASANEGAKSSATHAVADILPIEEHLPQN